MEAMLYVKFKLPNTLFDVVESAMGVLLLIKQVRHHCVNYDLE